MSGAHFNSLTTLTVVTEVVHKDNLLDEVFRTPVKDADDGTKEGGASLVVEGDDDGGGGELLLLPVACLAGSASGVRHLPVARHLRLVGISSRNFPSFRTLSEAAWLNLFLA